MKPSKKCPYKLGNRLVRDWLWWLDLLPKPSDKPSPFLGWRSWKNQETFERIGIPEAERAYLAGASAQYESEVVYHNMKEEFQKLGIVFTDTDSALKEYQTCLKQYFAKLVPPTDNKLAALNSTVWSGGTFIYVPKGVQGRYPASNLSSIINSETTGPIWTCLNYRWWGEQVSTLAEDAAVLKHGCMLY